MLLGKGPPRHDPRTLKLASYVSMRDLPAPPPAVNWHSCLASIPMLGNDRMGNCTVAAQAHLIQAWTANNGVEFCPPESDVVATYKAVTGYADTPDTDRGGNMLDMLNNWRKVGLSGHKIVAYLKLDTRDYLEMKIAINLFGGLYIGCALPKTTDRPGDWIAPVRLIGDAQPYSRGGHAMYLAGYDRSWVTFVTWNQRQRATWRWVYDYADEAYAVLSDDWAAVRSPNGFDRARLLADLVKLGAL